jgi:type II secretory pathway pseudopilin PulG
MKKSNIILLIVLLVILAPFLFSLIEKGIRANEERECLQWRQQARDYERVYQSAQWQIEQCKARGLPLPK